jgi:hypothetical protein
VIRVILAGAVTTEIATWSPIVQGLAVLGLVAIVLVVTLARSEKPTERLVALIHALRGAPRR